jgi:hypothetical protein
LDAQQDGCDWTFNKVPFLGISFYYKQKHVRILKGPGGVLPGCGKSKQKKRYFNQMPSMYLVGSTPMRTTANIVVLWDFDPAYALAQLWLALPARGAARPQDVMAFWCQPIPHPAEVTLPGTTVSDDGLEALVRLNVNEEDEEEQSVR